MMLMGENSRTVVVDRVKEKMAGDRERHCPTGVTIDTYYDRTDLVRFRTISDGR